MIYLGTYLQLQWMWMQSFKYVAANHWKSNLFVWKERKVVAQVYGDIPDECKLMIKKHGIHIIKSVTMCFLNLIYIKPIQSTSL